MDNRLQKIDTLADLEGRIENIRYEISINPDYIVPDDFYSCIRLARDLRDELGVEPNGSLENVLNSL